MDRLENDGSMYKGFFPLNWLFKINLKSNLIKKCYINFWNISLPCLLLFTCKLNKKLVLYANSFYALFLCRRKGLKINLKVQTLKFSNWPKLYFLLGKNKHLSIIILTVRYHHFWSQYFEYILHFLI